MVSAAAFCQFYLTGDLFLFLSFIPSQSILNLFQFEFSFSYYLSTITPNVSEINITVILFQSNVSLTEKLSINHIETKPSRVEQNKVTRSVCRPEAHHTTFTFFGINFGYMFVGVCS